MITTKSYFTIQVNTDVDIFFDDYREEILEWAREELEDELEKETAIDVILRMTRELRRKEPAMFDTVYAERIQEAINGL